MKPVLLLLFVGLLAAVAVSGTGRRRRNIAATTAPIYCPTHIGGHNVTTVANGHRSAALSINFVSAANRTWLSGEWRAPNGSRHPHAFAWNDKQSFSYTVRVPRVLAVDLGAYVFEVRLNRTRCATNKTIWLKQPRLSSSVVPLTKL